MRYTKLLVGALIGSLLIIFGLSNTETVVLKLLPENFERVGFVSGRYVLPIFLLVYLAMLTGIVFGIVYEFLRERKYRLKLRRKEKELRLLRKNKHNFVVVFTFYNFNIWIDCCYKIFEI